MTGGGDSGNGGANSENDGANGGNGGQKIGDCAAVVRLTLCEKYAKVRVLQEIGRIAGGSRRLLLSLLSENFYFREVAT